MERGRFACPSSVLGLAGLLKHGRRALLAGLGLAVLVHLSLARVTRLGEEQEAAKPLTTQFVKRQPRLTKPLELKKQPAPNRRRVQREMVSVQARGTGPETTSRVQASTAVGNLAKPELRVERGLGGIWSASEPQALAQRIEGARESRSVVDMSLEMLDVEVLDTGQYQAMVIQDPDDKRKVRGFFHMVYAYSTTMYNNDWHDMFSRRRVGLLDLIEAVNRYTDIRADLVGTVTFDQEELLSVPWVFAGSHFNFRLTQSEAQNLGRYLMIGGFLFADSGARSGSLMDQGLRLMIGDALEAQGLEKGAAWNMERLPNRHPVYHCYFDFPDGPPMASDWECISAPQNYPGGPFKYLEGVIIEDRLLAIMSMKWFVEAWSHTAAKANKQDPTRPRQFGVNVIVFALTQEGSITSRLMDSVGR